MAGIIRKLFRRKNEAKEKEIRYPFTQWYGCKHDVDFVDKETGKRTPIIDGQVNIVNFPGIEKGPWVSKLCTEEFLEPRITYWADFREIRDGLYAMIWTLQPDGRYEADEGGFGWGDEVEIVVAALIDKEGKFTGPFKICKEGKKEYPILEEAKEQ